MKLKLLHPRNEKHSQDVKLRTPQRKPKLAAVTEVQDQNLPQRMGLPFKFKVKFKVKFTPKDGSPFGSSRLKACVDVIGGGTLVVV